MIYDQVTEESGSLIIIQMSEILYHLSGAASRTWPHVNPLMNERNEPSPGWMKWSLNLNYMKYLNLKIEESHF